MKNLHSSPVNDADCLARLQQNVTGNLTLIRMAELAVTAGEAILYYYRQGVEVVSKADDSPVTRADIEASEIILAGLAKDAPHVFAVSEELIPEGGAPDSGEYFLIDPLDGTRSFIRGSGKFTVNIGYLRNNRPYVGVIYDPQTRRLYAGMDGLGVFRRTDNTSWQSVTSRTLPPEGLTLAISHSQISPRMGSFLEKLKGQVSVKEAKPLASSYKFCLLAEGAADMYPRFGPTMEWDTAAGHALVIAAGGEVFEADQTPLTYGKPEWKNGYFIAVANNMLTARLFG